MIVRQCPKIVNAFVKSEIVWLNTGLSHRAQDVVVSKKEATSFYKRFFLDNDIYEECYGEESCDFEEVVENYGHSEQSVGQIWFYLYYERVEYSSLTGKLVIFQ